MAGQLEEQELESTDAAHQLLDRRRPAGRTAQLMVHGGQRRKDRRELLRHAPRGRTRSGEEEFAARARIADAVEQVFDAVHGAQATRHGSGA